MNELVIAGVTIIQDENGRYNLNAMHQAAITQGILAPETEEKKRPGHWLKRSSTRALQQALEKRVSFLTLESIHGGPRSGTYAHEILTVEYAGWISPDFRITVNQAFIDSRKAPTLPTIHDHRTKVAIDTLLRLDAVEHELLEQRQALITQQQAMIAIQDLSLAALHGQQWLTIRQYVFLNDLSRQMPLTTQQDYARWLTGYCLEKGMPMYKAMTADRAWHDEKTYYVGAINDTLPGWLKRNQAGLSLVPGPSPTRDKDA